MPDNRFIDYLKVQSGSSDFIDTLQNNADRPFLKEAAYKIPYHQTEALGSPFLDSFKAFSAEARVQTWPKLPSKNKTLWDHLWDDVVESIEFEPKPFKPVFNIISTKRVMLIRLMKIVDYAGSPGTEEIYYVQAHLVESLSALSDDETTVKEKDKLPVRVKGNIDYIAAKIEGLDPDNLIQLNGDDGPIAISRKQIAEVHARKEKGCYLKLRDRNVLLPVTDSYGTVIQKLGWEPH